MAEATSNGETRFKIGDICRIADVQPYVLRYWESEFPVLAADKSVPGPRTYSERELKLIEQIKRLLYDEGYTIAGAKKRLESEGSGKPEAKAEAKPDTKSSVADTNPALAPLVDKPAPAPRPEKPKAPRPVKAAAPVFTDVTEVESAPAEDTKPVASPVAARADARVERAVAELKEVLALLSRPEP